MIHVFLRGLKPAVAVLIIFLALPVSAAWEQRDLGTIQSVHGITQVGSTYFAAGNSGTILRSTDAGKHWGIADNNAQVFWQDVVVDDTTVRAVGEGGTVRKSIDSGTTWESESLGITQTLYDGDFSGQYGFLVGDAGRIFTYHPSAKIWVNRVSPTTQTLYHVQSVGNGTAWIVGTQGVLVYTGDYGENWTNKGQVAPADLYGVWFVSPTTGFVVGKQGTMRKTTDAGASWSDVSIAGLGSRTLYDIRGNGNQLLAVGEKVIVMSSDAGATWELVDYTTENYTFKNGYFDNAGTMWAVGTQDDVKSVILSFAQPAEPVPDAGLENPNPPEQTTGAEPSEVTVNSLIKLACAANAGVNDPCKAVYFYGDDGKRHAFPNDKVFFTWYNDFQSVQTVSQAFLSSLPLGKNVTYHPGTRMVKFQSVPTVYAVAKGGVLRAIGSESVAAGLYGATWNKQIDDLSDAFFGNYTFGANILQASEYDVAQAKTSVSGLGDEY